MTPPDLQAVADGLSATMRKTLREAAERYGLGGLRVRYGTKPQTLGALRCRGLLETRPSKLLTPLGQQVRQLLIDREGQGK